LSFSRIFSCWEKNIYLSAGISDIASRYLSPEVEAFFIPRVKRRLEIISNQILERYGLIHTNMKEKIINKSININEDEMFGGNEFVKGTWQ
jgi:hypothetical protein